jgi:hypothetical protein
MNLADEQRVRAIIREELRRMFARVVSEERVYSSRKGHEPPGYSSDAWKALPKRIGTKRGRWYVEFAHLTITAAPRPVTVGPRRRALHESRRAACDPCATRGSCTWSTERSTFAPGAADDLSTFAVSLAKNGATPTGIEGGTRNRGFLGERGRFFGSDARTVARLAVVRGRLASVRCSLGETR